jgi:hypothetical protein
MSKFKSFDEYVNESVEQLQKIADMCGDGKIDTSKPSIFQYTIYRLPTEDEIAEFTKFPDLTADDILKGFSYTMIGRGILSESVKKMINDGIKMLVDKYPHNQHYSDALEMAHGLKKFKLFNQNVNEAVKYIYKFRDINFGIYIFIEQGRIWVNALAITSKDLDAIKDSGFSGDEIADGLVEYIKDKTGLEATWDASHHGAGYWAYITASDFQKLFK